MSDEVECPSNFKISRVMAKNAKAQLQALLNEKRETSRELHRSMLLTHGKLRLLQKLLHPLERRKDLKKVFKNSSVATEEKTCFNMPTTKW